MKRFCFERIFIISVITLTIITESSCGVDPRKPSNAVTNMKTPYRRELVPIVQTLDEIKIQRIVDERPLNLLSNRYGFVGVGSADKVLVEFYDYRCFNCRTSSGVVDDFLKKNRNYSFSLIDLPVMGENSLYCARADFAARRQEGIYLNFHNKLMSQNGNINQYTIDKIITDVGASRKIFWRDFGNFDPLTMAGPSLAAARLYGISGIPTFIINGKVHVGSIDSKTLMMLTNT